MKIDELWRLKTEVTESGERELWMDVSSELDFGDKYILLGW